jgi:ADP-heptose:LPS heptosyltransferase
LEINPERVKKYVFNIWIDFSVFAHGLHAFELRLTDAAGETRSFHDHIVIAPALKESDYPRSDGVIEVNPADPRPIEEQIRTRPSMIRDAQRVCFPEGIRNLLAMRTDQLGDMVASIPALRRLRQLLPDTRIVGLLTAANADLARTLGLFDEIIIAEFPDDPVQRRRVMTIEDQRALKDKLAPYAFDIAIDLAHSSVSRDLLPLSGAKFLYGHSGGDWPWLTGLFQFDTRDRHSLMETAPHSTKVLALVEALGTMFGNHAPIIRRDDLSFEALAAFRLNAEERFAVLHTGARLKFSHWPHYAALAARLLERTDLKIVMMADDPSLRSQLPEEVIGSDRFILIDRRLSFDEFDALISFATVVVGNDSGPKHLASLRGTPVVTLFTARINWTEWGQEEVGKIISRRVPCQGCAIFHDPEECGKDFACIRDISVDEVFEAVIEYV